MNMKKFIAYPLQKNTYDFKIIFRSYLKNCIFVLGLICLIIPLKLFAAEDFYSFTSKINQKRFYNLTSELRCLVCQNQNLAESNAPLANDLREEVYHQIQQGNSDKEIIKYLVARYGDFILYQPPFKKITFALWIGPFIFFMLGFFYLIFYIRHAQRE